MTVQWLYFASEYLGWFEAGDIQCQPNLASPLTMWFVSKVWFSSVWRTGSGPGMTSTRLLQLPCLSSSTRAELDRVHYSGEGTPQHQWGVFSVRLFDELVAYFRFWQSSLSSVQAQSRAHSQEFGHAGMSVSLCGSCTGHLRFVTQISLVNRPCWRRIE